MWGVKPNQPLFEAIFGCEGGDVGWIWRRDATGEVVLSELPGASLNHFPVETAKHIPRPAQTSCNHQSEHLSKKGNPITGISVSSNHYY